MKKGIYLDNAATTKIDPLVLREMLPFLNEEYGNASSPHNLGQKSEKAVVKARNIIAKSISASPEEIIFTSGGTESNNFAIKGIAFQNRNRGNHIITTKIEHPSVLNTFRWLEGQGFKISYVEADKYGFIDPKELDKAITKDTILFSIIHGQNEFGTIQDLEALGKICKKNNVYFHTDACQSYTKTDINVKKQAIDLITLNAHKIHGPKGIGVLYIRKGTRIMIWQHGGGQEMGRRSGTENVAGIVGFGKAVELALNKNHIKEMRKLKNILIKELIKIPRVKINGPRDERGLPNIVNAVFLGIEGEAIVGLLDIEKIYTATGSACSSNKLEPNPALLAIGLMHQEVNSTVRFSLSRFNTEKEIEELLSKLPGIVEKLRKFSPF